MIEGFWTAQFSVPQRGDIGQGVVVLSGGKVFGGDSMNTYVGEYALDGKTVRITLKVEPYGTPQGPNVFGTTGRVDLLLQGQIGETGFTVQGQSPLPIQIRLAKQSGL